MKNSDLTDLDEGKLRQLLVEVSKLSKENDAFLKSKLKSNHKDLFALSCKKIDKAFSCFELMSLKDARQAISDFKKSNPDDSLLVELYLHYIYSAYDLEKTDWRFQENFYSSIERVYNLVFEILKKNPVVNAKYKAKVEKLIKISNEGWGHRDYLEDKFEEIE